ncbi:MAG: PA2778 family cysteine peptidase [Gammaproteobacteria bacterium]|nr:PA2778 family cysteine peptidase [Gammaproteobacteria bacterium]NNL06723.1 PA2778 family cysteine peptidase [Gammaproteobacteria bacterium]
MLIRVLVCLLCLNGCTTFDTSRVDHAVNDEGLPSVFELKEVPFFPQTDYQCGPAALATVLQTHNVYATPDDLVSSLYLPDPRGSLQVEIAASARLYTMLPYPLEPDITALLTEVAAGNPVLVLQNLRFDWWPQWHYAVVVGYDIEQQAIILRSGETRRWQTSFRTFVNTWKRADHWALVIVPAGDIPATADFGTYMKTAYAFEETGLMNYAFEAYRAATQKWPQEARPWIMLGTLAYTLDNNRQAVEALLQASGIDAGSATTWNNLAYALHKNGCALQAQQALQCARQASLDDMNILDSQREIETMAVQVRASDCPLINCAQDAEPSNLRAH